jgi:hypothetical protein
VEEEDGGEGRVEREEAARTQERQGQQQSGCCGPLPGCLSSSQRARPALLLAGPPLTQRLWLQRLWLLGRGSSSSRHGSRRALLGSLPGARSWLLWQRAQRFQERLRLEEEHREGLVGRRQGHWQLGLLLRSTSWSNKVPGLLREMGWAC